MSTRPKPTSYLEIGVDEGRTFKKIKSTIKHGVDPYGTFDVDFRMTSQMFFALNKLYFHLKFDIIFIDASHFSLIVDTEIEESLKILKRDGYIVLHDTDPPTKEACEIVLKDTLLYLRNLSYPHNSSHKDSLTGKVYNGDVWKSIARIRMMNSKLKVFTVENFCCTVLKRGKQKTIKRIPFEKLDWNYFVRNRKEILNLIPFDEIDLHL